MPTHSEEFLDTLIKVNRKMRTLFDARAKEMGLTLSRARLLVQLAREDGPTQTQLAQHLDVEQPSIVGLVDALEKAGLVERRANGGDRRQRTVHLTPAARDQAGDLLSYVAKLRSEILRNLSEDDLREANRIMGCILTNVCPVMSASAQD